LSAHDVIEGVVYKRWGSACCICTQTTANQRSQNAYITWPALFSKHSRICTLDQTKVELFHLFEFSAPCGNLSNASQKMPNKKYATLLCKPRYLYEQSKKVSCAVVGAEENRSTGLTSYNSTEHCEVTMGSIQPEPYDRPQQIAAAV